MKVDFYNFKYAPNSLLDLWRSAVEQGIKDGVFIGGLAVNKFEEEFAQATGTRYAVGVSNGYDGLEIALRALGVGAGKRVAIPAHTFIATWNAVIAVGAIPVGIDVSEDGQINVQELVKTMERMDIDCVVPVHMHGHVSDIQFLRKLCDKRGILMIEDASQAHLASRDGFMAGSIGDIGVFSLYPTKNLGALGDAGVIVTNKAHIAQKVRSLCNYGSAGDNKYVHNELGFNRRLDALQARILSENLKFLVEWNSLRKYKSNLYIEHMQELGINFLRGRDGSVWHHFCIFSKKRDMLQSYLRNRGIGTEIHYPRLAAHEAEKFMSVRKGLYPVAETFSANILSLPLSQFHSDSMIEFVCDNLRMAVRESLF